MKTKLTNVTPEMARTILRSNTHNRPVRQSHVDYLAGEIINGRWLLTHQGICLAEDGTVLDGQHRLLAIVQSNTPVEMLVSTGADMEAQLAIDTGASLRGVGDMLHLMDGVKNAAIVAAACRQIVSMSAYFQSYKVSVGLTKIVYDEFRREIEFSVAATNGFKNGHKGWIIGVLSFCHKADKRTADFITKFGSGEDLRSGDPAKVARDWLINGTSMMLKNLHKRGAIEGFCNAAFNANNGASLAKIMTGSRGFDYFAGKNRAFVESIRAQLSQQIVQRQDQKKKAAV